MAILAVIAIVTACGTDNNADEAVEKKEPQKVRKAEPKIEVAVDTSALLVADTLIQPIDTVNLANENVMQGDSSEVPNESEEYAEQTEEDGDFQSWFDDHSQNEMLDEAGDPQDQELAENRLIFSKVIPVRNLQYKDSYDSVLVVIEERLSIRPDPASDQVVLEKWISPVNYRGYKFNRKKLMLFGVDMHLPVNVYHYVDTYFFTVGDRVYELNEHLDFKPFQLVADTALSEYLLSHDDRF